MNFKDFESGQYKQQYAYKSFLPSLINREWTWDDPRINVLLEKATNAMSELNAFSLIVHDIDLFIRMHIFKEANTSSRIEGTKTRIDEDLLDEEFVPVEKRDDWREVNNYVKAMNTAIDELKRLPLSMRLIKKTHEILMDGVRGEFRTPGEFRKSQNWIGGSSLNDAVFIPPHHTDIPDLITDLEFFIHNESIQVPHLIRCALIHYQFETIHPFLDGNGRIGRLIITLYFISKKLLNKPSLYLSDFFERNRSSYYDALSRVRESNDLVHWVRFFLQAVIDTANKGKSKFMDIRELQRNCEEKIRCLGRRAENAHKLIEFLYSYPSITVNDTAKLLNQKYQAANNMIEAFTDMGILYEMTGNGRNRIFVFKKYLELFL